MFFIGYFLIALAKVIGMLLTIYLWIIIALYPIRRKLPVSYGGIDFSPIIVFLVIMFLNSWLVPSIERFSAVFLH